MAIFCITRFIYDLIYFSSNKNPLEMHVKMGLRPANLLKKRLWYRCFLVNFAKFLRVLFYRTPPMAASVHNFLKADKRFSIT